MKLSDYAKKLGVSYKTAWRMWKRGEIKATQLPTGTIIVTTEEISPQGVAIYTRVSSAENKSNLDSQAERLKAYCIAKGYQIKYIVKEVGSGVNDNRKKLVELLLKDDYSLIICEHKDRLTRVGFNYLKVLLNKQGKDIEVVNLAEERKDDLMQDFVAIITSFCARFYSIRKRTRKTECLIQCLKENQNEVSSEASN
ncbi:IS607 family transposase [Cyanobacterium aponinum UTEX 3222]|uniref:IS607 family transposase n=1 Tax=Cyanobacterium aponinum TaxID=379064 RepID=UPI002B4BC65D|nr:IS607 family transposase [Cyanobacterium aponinum]WRL39372.1 IS607 family transposase [Cyanobacterium aponinum UTEX 3221]WRL43931.1 IS607 family transposase [Cyanobacterium aponinum UTEX 3222]